MARNKKARSLEEIQNIKKDRLGGLTYSELRDKYKISKSTLSYHLKEFNKENNLHTIELTERFLYKSPIGPKIKAKRTGYKGIKKYLCKIENQKRFNRIKYRSSIGPKLKGGKQFIILNCTINPKTGCWEWNNSLTSAGYGQLTINKKYWTSHRYSYTVFNGLIPEGLIVRHMCHNPTCCNPKHLKLGTHKDNYHDSIDNHRKAIKLKCFNVFINRNKYNSFSEASRFSGINRNTIKKYTDKDTRIFNIDEYRKGCKLANKTPRI